MRDALVPEREKAQAALRESRRAPQRDRSGLLPSGLPSSLPFFSTLQSWQQDMQVLHPIDTPMITTRMNSGCEGVLCDMSRASSGSG